MYARKTGSVVLGFFLMGFLPVLTNQAAGPLEDNLRPAIVSFMPDFYEFWSKAKDKPVEEKVELWDSLFENKHAEFYRSVIYQRSSRETLEQIKSRMLQGFLEKLKDDGIQSMKDCEPSVKELIPQALEDLGRQLPDEKGTISFYLIPSLGTSSGAARPFKGDMVVYHGLEQLSLFKNPEDIKAIIAHESFHVLHFRHIYPHYREKYGENVSMMNALQGEGLLFLSFMEGLAVYAVERLYPGISRPGLIEKNVPLYEKNFTQYTKEFVRDLEDFNYRKYQRYFMDPSGDEAIPEKFGYWLGYKIVKSLVEEFSIQEMMTWIPEEGVRVMREEIEKTLAM